MKLFLLAVLPLLASAACPNKCSGHGTCLLGDRCSCQPRWISPDCSLRECPYGLSWTTSADTDDSPAGTGGFVLAGKTSAAGSGTTAVLDDTHDAQVSTVNDAYNGMTISFLATGYSKVITDYVGGTRTATFAATTTTVGTLAQYVITNDANNADNGRHAYTECSSKGACDRSTGECACFPGYEGRGCRRQVCPNACSGHGRCRYNNEINPMYTPHAGDERNEFQSQYWDYQKTRQCICDRGYEGYDCSSRTCPKGDDPLTDCGMSGGEVSDIQELLFNNMVGDAGHFTLTFTDMFMGNYTTKPIKVYAAPDASELTLTAAAIETALEELPNFAVPNVTVTALAGTKSFAAGAARADAKNGYAITFLDEANSGRQQLLVCSNSEKASVYASGDDGLLNNNPNAQPRFVPMTTTANNRQVSCYATSESDTMYGESATIPANQYKYKEHIECSGRGSCDPGSGTCQCFEGFTGEACASQTVFF